MISQARCTLKMLMLGRACKRRVEAFTAICQWTRLEPRLHLPMVSSEAVTRRNPDSRSDTPSQSLVAPVKLRVKRALTSIDKNQYWEELKAKKELRHISTVSHCRCPVVDFPNRSVALSPHLTFLRTRLLRANPSFLKPRQCVKFHAHRKLENYYLRNVMIRSLPNNKRSLI